MNPGLLVSARRVETWNLLELNGLVLLTAEHEAS